MITVSQIRERLVDLLVAYEPDGALGAFEEWLAASSWNMHLDSDVDAAHMTGKLQLMFAEFDDGSLSKAELRRNLLELVSTFEISTEPPVEKVITSGSSNRGASFSQFGWTAVSDTPRAEGPLYTPPAQLQS